ncbi:TPA: hypothetical protein RQJ57_004248 [Vibrio vulnificus]|nr:hypothetical protein [Vibrio vulnificus]
MKSTLSAIEVFVSERNLEPSKHLGIVSEIVRALTNHIEDIELLTESEISGLVQKLISYTILSPVPIPLSSEMPIIRAVRYDLDQGIGYTDTSRLSYIPLESDVVPKLGRLNSAGESMFYGSLGVGNNSVGTILSECRAESGDVYNVLYCKTDKNCQLKLKQFPPSLYVVPIGVFDHFRRGVPEPFGLNDDFKEMYNFMHNCAEPDLSMALHLCDAFLTDVLSRREFGKLYEVTSKIAKECMKAPEIDGVLYPSIQLSGHPNLALKPSSVKQKITYVKATSIAVEESYHYCLHKIKSLGDGDINEAEIVWRSKP